MINIKTTFIDIMYKKDACGYRSHFFIWDSVWIRQHEIYKLI